MRGKKVAVVIGLGQFGSALAHTLSREWEVLAIDMDQQRVDAVADSVHRALVLDARDLEALRSVVSADFDEAVVSMGENLEASILSTLHLHQLGVRSIRAKAISEDHAAILELVGASQVIFPERETARRVAEQMMRPNLVDFLPLEQDYLIQDVPIPEVFAGRSIGELRLRTHFNALVLAVRRLEEPHFLFLPGPDYVCRPADVMVMVGRRGDLVALASSAQLPPLV